MKDKIHVLLIEDNLSDARLVQGMLEHDKSNAFTFKHVSSLGEGISSLEPGSRSQVILLDLGLPMQPACRPCGESCLWLRTQASWSLPGTRTKSWELLRSGKARTTTSSRVRWTEANCEESCATPSSGTKCKVSSVLR